MAGQEDIKRRIENVREQAGGAVAVVEEYLSKMDKETKFLGKLNRAQLMFLVSGAVLAIATPFVVPLSLLGWVYLPLLIVSSSSVVIFQTLRSSSLNRAIKHCDEALSKLGEAKKAVQ